MSSPPSTLDEKLSYLSDKNALEQYIAVNQKKSELTGKLQKIKDYQTLLHKIENDLLNIDKQLAEESLKTNQYLIEMENEREKYLSLFTQLVKKVYPNSPSGISLKNNRPLSKPRSPQLHVIN